MSLFRIGNETPSLALGRVTLDSMALAATLLTYSEQNAEYTQALQRMIDYNQLTLTDEMQLYEREPVYFDQDRVARLIQRPAESWTINSNKQTTHDRNSPD